MVIESLLVSRVLAMLVFYHWLFFWLILALILAAQSLLAEESLPQRPLGAAAACAAEDLCIAALSAFSYFRICLSTYLAIMEAKLFF